MLISAAVRKITRCARSYCLWGCRVIRMHAAHCVAVVDRRGSEVQVATGGEGGTYREAKAFALVALVFASLAAAGHLQFVLGDIMDDTADSPLHKALAKHAPYDLV